MTKSSSAIDEVSCTSCSSSLISESNEKEDATDDALASAAAHSEDKVDDDVDQVEEWTKRYEMSLFLLTQFNVHYLSWIKYPEHLADFINRFVCLVERVFHLPEFESPKAFQVEASTTKDDKGQLQEWLYEQSKRMCYSYRRQLILRFPSVSGQTEGKKLRISLMEKEGKISEQIETSSDEQQQICPNLTLLTVLGDIDICSDVIHVLQVGVSSVMMSL